MSEQTMQGSQILPGVSRRELCRREDARGWLLKLLMREHISGPLDFGEAVWESLTPSRRQGIGRLKAELNDLATDLDLRELCE